MSMDIGILGIGVFLPEKVRTNEHWPASVVDGWRERLKRRMVRMEEQFAQQPGDAAPRVLAALRELAGDPFQAGLERREMAPDMLASDMETAAARRAIAAANIDPREVGIVLSHTLCPDYINVPAACVVHANLGLRPDCLSMAVDAVCNSFLMQVVLARDLLASGRAKYALLTQASAITRLNPSNEPHDSWLGDAATAVILGPVPEGRGLRSFATRTDGTLHKALMVGIPGGRWFDGKAYTYSDDHAANFSMMARIGERAREVADEALATAQVRPDEVDFYACHQAFKWLRPVTQDLLGFTRARSVDTFPWAGTVSSCNLPLVMSIAQNEGLLRDGDNVFLFQGGTGMTWSGMTMRWSA
jgi:3-oxoacyl-[acyl-carrier-protein] synthase III